MKIKQVTVFGGSGFVGQAIVRALAPHGYLVRVACRRIELAERVKTAGDVGQITLMRANLRVPQSVARAIEGSQAVINAAGIAFQRGRQSYKAVHGAGARTIAEAARAAGVRNSRQAECRGREPARLVRSLVDLFALEPGRQHACLGHRLGMTAGGEREDIPVEYDEVG